MGNPSTEKSMRLTNRCVTGSLSEMSAAIIGRISIKGVIIFRKRREIPNANMIK
jgi:hypothetical protein